ncbi:hypothetical protein KEM48_008746 [Puccinia striiformis f. sp. tritici PST-130]|nr:hypothetical protein KEM48_008746 [Puccinia striiformis f. sp. tritici PST-130]
MVIKEMNPFHLSKFKNGVTNEESYISKFTYYTALMSEIGYRDRCSPRMYFPEEKLTDFINKSNYMNLIHSKDFTKALNSNGISLNRVLTVVLILGLEEEELNLDLAFEDIHYMAKILFKIMSPSLGNPLYWIDTPERNFLVVHYKDKFTSHFESLILALRYVTPNLAMKSSWLIFSESDVSEKPDHHDMLKQGLSLAQYYKRRDSILKLVDTRPNMQKLDEMLPSDLISNLQKLQNMMPNILDLPWHVFEVIYKHLPKDGVFLWTMFSNETQDISVPGTKTMTGKLRLVCRQWADWLYVHHLYRTLSFEDGNRAMRFIIHQITRRSKSFPRARCRSLQVINILTWGPPPLDPATQHPMARAMMRKRGEVITFEILEALIELFSDSICELDLRFWNVLSLPTRTIGTIGRIENLHTLRLGHELPEKGLAPQHGLHPILDDSDDEDFDEQIRRHNDNMDLGGLFGNPSTPIDMNPVKSKIDHDCLKSLILATRKLTSLDIIDLDPVCLPKPMKSSFIDHQFPAITQLEVSLEGQSLSRLKDLSILLKPTLKVLSLKDRLEDRDHSENLLPVFENLRETLEGLFITNESMIKPIINLEFPKLRVFKTIFWDGSIIDLLEKPIFAHSPIEVLVLQSEIIDHKPKGKFRSNPFTNLPMLKRLVFCDVRPGYSPPPAYVKACKARRVECVYLSPTDGENVSLIMVSFIKTRTLASKVDS